MSQLSSKLASLKMMQMAVGRMWPGGILGSIVSLPLQSFVGAGLVSDVLPTAVFFDPKGEEGGRIVELGNDLFFTVFVFW